ncbi:MAG: FAD-dependent oxidoreductase [Myxococcales bacterium]|nr:FAD-dependent oxidoreductase [Myxococcales bacterium]
MSRVVVVGGGLSGMISAREIARRGHSVLLLEASKRLGGKAGADVKDGRIVEHGYHVFPAWYPNVRALLSELGVTLTDFDRYHYLDRGKFPEVITVRGPASVSAVLHDTFNGLLPWYEQVLFAYFTLDMVGRSLSEKRLLDRVSTIGLMRQAWYMTERVAELNQENMLKASAIPAYDMSAMTAKRIGGFWLRQASPFLSVLPGDLQSTFIDPLAKTVTDAGVEVRLEQRVKSVEVDGGSLVTRVVLEDGTSITADAFILATPLEVTRAFVDGDVYRLDPSLGDINDLEMRPMAAMQVKLRSTLPNVPREHVFLHGGRYGLSFIDAAQAWPNQPTTNLCFIASNYVPLMNVDDDAAKDALMGEIREYLPIPDTLIDAIDLNSNVASQLFINTIGAWPDRPAATTKIANLFVCGDYAQNSIDLACMEGAVSSALLTAAALVRRYGGPPVPEPKVPPTFPRPLLLALKAALAPGVALASGLARARDLLRGTPP